MSEFGNDIIALKILFNQNEFKWVKPVIVTEDLLICEDTDGTIINVDPWLIVDELRQE